MKTDTIWLAPALALGFALFGRAVLCAGQADRSPQTHRPSFQTNFGGVGDNLTSKELPEPPGPTGPIRAVVTPTGQLSYFIGVFRDPNVIAYKPLPTQAFEARLLDPEGSTVPKTRDGLRFGRPLVADPELLDPMHHKILNVLRDERTVYGEGHEWDLDLLKSFRVRSPGRYSLEVQVRLFVRDTNGVFKPLFLPPVRLPVEIPATVVHPPPGWGRILLHAFGLVLCALGSAWLWSRRTQK